MAGFLGAVMLAGTVLLGVEARTAKTDACAVRHHSRRPRGAGGSLAAPGSGEALGLGLILLFWGALGVGILLKGPIILLVTGGRSCGCRW